MGNSSACESSITEGWLPHFSLAGIYFNHSSGRQLRRHMVTLQNYQQQFLAKRMNETHPCIAKIEYFRPIRLAKKSQHPSSLDTFEIFTDAVYPICKQNWKPIHSTLDVLKGFRRLATAYGYFKVCEGMISMNEKSDIKVWIHTNPALSRVASPIESQLEMLSNLKAVIRRYDSVIGAHLDECKDLNSMVNKVLIICRQRPQKVKTVYISNNLHKYQCEDKFRSTKETYDQPWPIAELENQTLSERAHLMIHPNFLQTTGPSKERKFSSAFSQASKNESTYTTLPKKQFFYKRTEFNRKNGKLAQFNGKSNLISSTAIGFHKKQDPNDRRLSDFSPLTQHFQTNFNEKGSNFCQKIYRYQHKSPSENHSIRAGKSQDQNSFRRVLSGNLDYSCPNQKSFRQFSTLSESSSSIMLGTKASKRFLTNKLNKAIISRVLQDKRSSLSNPQSCSNIQFSKEQSQITVQYPEKFKIRVGAPPLKRQEKLKLMKDIQREVKTVLNESASLEANQLQFLKLEENDNKKRKDMLIKQRIEEKRRTFAQLRSETLKLLTE